MKQKILLTAVLSALLQFFIPPAVVAQNQPANDDIYMNDNNKSHHNRDEQRRNRQYRDEADHEDRQEANESGDNGDEEYSHEAPKNSRDMDDDEYARKDSYICRPGHHYHCRHDRDYRHHYSFPGGYVRVQPGRHGRVATRIWIPGHWSYSAGGHRYWVPGHHSYDTVRW